jgi:hypothetical protein
MFWGIKLPFQITLILFIFIVIIITLIFIGKKRDWNLPKTLLRLNLALTILFIPSCAAINMVVDHFRFGVFQYASFNELNDYKSKRYTPNDATNIVVEKAYSGQIAKYNISKTDLLKYLRIHNDDTNADHLRKIISSNDEYPMSLFKNIGYPKNILLEEFTPQRAPNGAGATYYYDENNQTCYHRADYYW